MQELNHVMEGDDLLGGEQGNALLDLMATKLAEVRAGAPAEVDIDLLTIAVHGNRVLSTGEMTRHGLTHTGLAVLRMIGHAYQEAVNHTSTNDMDPHLIGLAILSQTAKGLLAGASDDTTTH